MEKWQDRTCRQGLEGRLLQDDTRRPRSPDVDAFRRGLRCCEPSQSVKNQRQRVQCVPTCFRQESSSDGRCCFGVWRSRSWRSEPAADRRIGTGTVDDYETIALQASLVLDHKSRWKRALHHAAKHYEGELHVGPPLWFWGRGANAAKKPTNAFRHPVSNTLTTVWTTYRGSVVQVCKIQVRPFHDDDEAAHEYVTEHMRDLENGYCMKATSRMRTSLDKMNLPWTTHRQQKKTERRDPAVKDRWMWTPQSEDE